MRGFVGFRLAFHDFREVKLGPLVDQWCVFVDLAYSSEIRIFALLNRQELDGQLNITILINDVLH